ncbi:hypothetical protein JOQ06_023455 [Pogonophryne albipinna]|uniref:G-protein coupled receptors family 1 profile domain-containing protein n=1 Tax=Pogonophryne albipinna TaxID=1090488 RepID=A0AAD6BN04_9TELE|nr:hypothetical protein JOQ06_023455 [Pogonophryne albipinna]
MENNNTNCDSIDDFRNQVYSTAYSLITVFGLVGNGLALVVLIRTASGTLADFLCRISSYALYVNLYCSIYFMAAMSFTRFLAIVFPVQNMRLVTENRSRLVCVCIWVVICLLSSPFLMSGQSVDHLTNKTKCFEPPKPGSVQKLVVLNYLSLGVGFILPFLVILVCYAGIVRALLYRNHTARRQRVTDTKVIRMIVIVLLTFLISFMPYHVQRTIHLNSLFRENAPCSEQIAMQKSVVVTLSLAAANSCFDPLLYFFSGEGFRSRLSSLRRSMRSNNQKRIARMKTTINPEIVENHQLKAS